VLNHELMLRVGFADNGTVEDLLAALDATEAQLASMYAQGIEQIEGYLADGGPYPERLHLIALASDFNGRFLELCHDWIEDVRAEVGDWPTTVALGSTEPTRRRLLAVLRRARAVRWRTSASIVPAPTATPFPPLKPRKSGYMCPTTAAAAASTQTSSLSETLRAMRTAATPFPMSSAITSTPILRPRTRITFVAPVFPEPARRRSIPRRRPAQ
jgi:hypothetical protein